MLVLFRILSAALQEKVTTLEGLGKLLGFGAYGVGPIWAERLASSKQDFRGG